MKSLSRSLLVLLICAAVTSKVQVLAQTASDLNEGSILEHDSENGIFRFKWFGKSGRTYFIQHSEDLMQPWLYVPIIESGDESVKEWGFTSTGDRFFLRLKYSDIPTTDPAGADFDGDGLSNLAEVQAGADPLDTDSDDDGLPDGWEDSHGLNPMNAADAAIDSDDDGLTSLEEYNAGTDPRKFSSGNNGVADGWWLQHGLNPYANSSVDTDGDGRSDETEFLHGTNPNAADQAPDYPFPSDAPRNLVAKENADGSYDLSWEYSPGDRKRFVIERQRDDGAWEQMAVVGPNIRSYHVPAPQ
jgi:hypothetical protein